MQFWGNFGQIIGCPLGLVVPLEILDPQLIAYKDFSWCLAEFICAENIKRLKKMAKKLNREAITFIWLKTKTIHLKF